MAPPSVPMVPPLLTAAPTAAPLAVPMVSALLAQPARPTSVATSATAMLLFIAFSSEKLAKQPEEHLSSDRRGQWFWVVTASNAPLVRGAAPSGLRPGERMLSGASDRLALTNRDDFSYFGSLSVSIVMMSPM